ncbi:unnamed protein product [Soboliphyme baturini]|uniref:Protein kinase domain-containing protein n=1 Tax=Soboliphyme baturini TaxID=241478 RepID=A0A183IQE9_9BILA|nr:unnamed protein product [Soboliphyme baturini]
MLEATRVYRLGHEAHAQPAEKLQRAYAEFLARNGIEAENRTSTFLNTFTSPFLGYRKEPMRFGVAPRHNMCDKPAVTKRPLTGTNETVSALLPDLSMSRLTIGEATFAKSLVASQKLQLRSTPSCHSGIVVKPSTTPFDIKNATSFYRSESVAAAASTRIPQLQMGVTINAPVADDDMNGSASKPPISNLFDGNDTKQKYGVRKSEMFAEPPEFEDDGQDLDKTGYGLQEDINSTINPWDPSLVEKLLGKVRRLQTKSGHFHVLPQLLPRISTGTSLLLDAKTFVVEQLIGKGAFANIYLCTLKHTSEKIALKVQKPGCPWEQYISETIFCRIKQKNLDLVENGFAWIKDAYVFSNGSMMTMEYFEHQTLLHLVNRYRLRGQSMKEPIVAYLALEMLKLLDALRAIDVIHADIKPDNFVFVRPPAFLEGTDVNDVDFVQLPVSCIKLIDFGRSIDMSLLPPGSSFTGVVHTSNFVCCEMQDGRPWTYQTDYFGLLGTICVLIDGKYMTTFKLKAEGKWKSTVSIQRSWNAELWLRLFSSLLNIPSCVEQPDLGGFITDFSKFLNQTVRCSYCDWMSELRKLKKILA